MKILDCEVLQRFGYNNEKIYLATNAENTLCLIAIPDWNWSFSINLTQEMKNSRLNPQFEEIQQSLKNLTTGEEFEVSAFIFAHALESQYFMEIYRDSLYRYEYLKKLRNIKINDITGDLFDLKLGCADIIKELTAGTTEKITVNITDADDFIRRIEVLDENEDIAKVVHLHYEEWNDVEGKITKVELQEGYLFK
ncbi:MULTISPECIES: YueH family protein [Bacillus amyloliquefaciens group]|uniref:Uncharacterized protein n=1 Tax=Bacillus velezensis TaxID=492670 RepID=A0ABC8DEZ6_BACVE|nr:MULTISPECIES: YueH family protein [Bacillus amyloliquefaciens group]AVI31060.1 hypothetical protein C3Z10_21935 [Bacillus velezensis]AWX74612.1 hypothetical protein BVDSYZ_21445 [Bacillus velezensis]MDK2561831.1 YueH family protein [Bacillus amyloliquefaciens]